MTNISRKIEYIYNKTKNLLENQKYLLHDKVKYFR